MLLLTATHTTLDSEGDRDGEHQQVVCSSIQDGGSSVQVGVDINVLAQESHKDEI